MATGSSLLGTHPLDVLTLDGTPEVATFGSTASNMFIRLYDSNTYCNCYYIGKSNTVFSLFTDSGKVNIGFGTTTPLSNASLQVQGTILTCNIGTYTGNTLYFNNQNIANISNISLSGTLLDNMGNPFRTSQWNTYNTNNIYIACNVAIGATDPINDATGTNSNLYVNGDVYITGNVKMGTLTASAVASTSTLDSYGSYITANIYQPNQSRGKIINTSDPNIGNRILYTANIQLGRYLFNGNIIFSNLNTFSLFGSTKWAQLELYNMTSTALIAAGSSAVPIRVAPFTTIHSSSDGYDNVMFDWLVNFNTTYWTTVCIVVSGKGASLWFDPPSAPLTSYFGMMPIRGMGYDQNLSINRTIQLNPVVSTSVVTRNSSNVFPLSLPGYFQIYTSNVEVYVNGSKKIYVGPSSPSNEYTVSPNGVLDLNGNSTYSVTLSSAANIGDKVDITAWPTATSDNFFQSGYMYQTIFASSSPWQLINDGGARISGKVAIDGDLYVQGSIWGGCNTTTFSSGSFGYGSNFTNMLSNAIGTENIIDGAITPSKLNFLTGNIGIGTLTPIQPLHVNGQALFSSNIFVNGKCGSQNFLILNLTNETSLISSTNNIYTYRSPADIYLYSSPKISLNISPPSAASCSIDILVGSTIGSVSTILSSPIIINSGSYSATGTLVTTFIPDDSVITFNVVYTGTTGASGLKATLYYQLTF